MAFGSVISVPAATASVVVQICSAQEMPIFASVPSVTFSIRLTCESPDSSTRLIWLSVSVLMVASVVFASAADCAAAAADDALVFAQSSAFAARFRISSRN